MQPVDHLLVELPLGLGDPLELVGEDQGHEGGVEEEEVDLHEQLQPLTLLSATPVKRVLRYPESIDVRVLRNTDTCPNGRWYSALLSRPTPSRRRSSLS